MKKQLILSISLFFAGTAFSMEERTDYPKIEDLQNLQTNQVDQNQTSDTNRSFFDLLPDEIVEYIFSLLVEEAYAKGSTPLEKLIAILSNKDLANIKSVNTRWKSIVLDKGISNKITNLTNHLVQNNKKHFENKLFEICRQEIYEENNNTKTLSLVNLCLKKTIAVTKQKYSQGLKTNLNSLPIELKEKIINHIQPLKTLKCLLITGVDSNARDRNGYTALICAAFHTKKEVITLILNHIKKFDIFSQLEIISAKDKFGNTALMIPAANTHRNEALKLMLNHINNFDANSQLKIINAKNDHGNTTLMVASYFNRREIVELILNHIKNFDINSQLEIINTKNAYSNTALSATAFYNNKEAAVLILNHIKDFDITTQLAIINAKNTLSETALDIAKEFSYGEIIKLLEDAINRIEIQDWIV